MPRLTYRNRTSWMQVAPYPGLCWPHDSQACLAHITTMILNCGRVASDMRSPHTLSHTISHAGESLYRQTEMMQTYARA